MLTVLNGEILRHGAASMFCTALYAHAVATRAAPRPDHLPRRPPGRADPEGRSPVEEAGRPGTLLGFRTELELTDDRFRLSAGDALVLYTDGVTERRDGNHMFEEERLIAILQTADPEASAEQIVALIDRAITDFSDEPPQDDIAIVVIRPLAGDQA